jgi:hypothetical protein
MSINPIELPLNVCSVVPEWTWGLFFLLSCWLSTLVFVEQRAPCGHNVSGSLVPKYVLLHSVRPFSLLLRLLIASFRFFNPLIDSLDYDETY